MVENKKVVKDHIISDGDWCWAVPMLAYQAHRDGDGNEIKAQYATKNELASETNARIEAVTNEATERQNADNLKLDIPQFVFEGSEEGNECYISKGTDDFVPPEGVIPIANIGNLTVTGSLNYDKMVTINTTQTITGMKTINKADAVLILKHPTLDASSHNQGNIYQEVTFRDKYEKEIGNIINWTTDGNTRLILETKNLVSNVTAQTGIVVRDDGVSYAPVPTVTNNTPSNGAVNKGYVESTDGVTNNLVHRSSNEILDGFKTFNTGMCGRFGWGSRVTGTTKIVLCDIKRNSSSNNQEYHVCLDYFGRYSMFRGWITFVVTSEGNITNLRKNGWGYGTTPTTALYVYSVPATYNIRIAIGNQSSADNHINANIIGGYQDAGYIITLDYSTLGVLATSDISDDTAHIELGE